MTFFLGPRLSSFDKFNPYSNSSSNYGYDRLQDILMDSNPLNSSDSVTSGREDEYLTNNDFMSYLEGLLASVGQENVENRLFNADQAALARDFSASEAQKNRDFQERMSNTSYQRAVVDLQAAGLNPILAYQQGGATTPNSSSTQTSSASYQSSGGDTFSSVLNAFANLISSASDILDVFAPSLSKVLK